MLLLVFYSHLFIIFIISALVFSFFLPDCHMSYTNYLLLLLYLLNISANKMNLIVDKYLNWNFELQINMKTLNAFDLFNK